MAHAALSTRTFMLAAVITCAGSTATAETASDRQAGKVHFPISCSADAQQRFDRALAVLHSFWYEEAAKQFTAVAAADPGCAMAQWGIAMSVWYPLWYPPGDKAMKTGTDADKVDHRTRSVAYEKAMEQLYLRYPDDSEAAVFYALALDATAPPTDKSLANQRKAAAILEKVHAEQPSHPGVAHYLIHSYDSAPLAEAGLPAARSYAALAPDVPHALHMPSHIFTRVGLWQESIASNERSAAAGQAYAREAFGPGVLWDQSLHAMDYLEYAYLQGAQDVAAKHLLDQITAGTKAEPASLAAAYAIAVVHARFALERRSWTEAANISAPSVALPWERFPWATAMISFTRALGAARTGDTAAAKADVAELEALHAKLVEAKNAYWADQVEVQRRAAAAMLARAVHDDADALAQLRSATELESSMEKHPVTPGAVVPARELLADLLLELGQPAAALREYEVTLGTDPNRFRSLFGAGLAAEQSGDMAKARRFYENLAALTANADTQRPELQTAQAFLAKAQ